MSVQKIFKDEKNIQTLCRVSAYSILVGVFAYIVAVALLGYLRPGYSHMTNLVSELGETGATYSYVLNITLIFNGLVMMLFAYCLHVTVNRGKGSKIGITLIGYLGLAVFFGGVFPCDKGCVNPETLSGYLHLITGLPVMLALPIGLIIFAKRLNNDKNWRQLSRFSLLIGILLLPLFFASATLFPMLKLSGLGQRIATTFQLLWPTVMAVKMLKVINKKPIA